MLEKLKENYGENLKIALMLGGLRPETTEPITTELREEILHHWHMVHEKTGQNFNFDNPMPDGFIYNTEPASRAVIAISEINPECTLPYFKSIQEAFYCERKNVAEVTVLKDLACGFSIDPDEFMDHFVSENVKNKTLSHFQHTRQAEVRGFPTLVISAERSFKMLANGYRPFDDIRREIDNWLSENSLNEASK